jgi:hypothetical protein
VSVSRDEVLKIARLAELHVDEATLPTLVGQMSRILDYVAQIATVAGSETSAALAGPGGGAVPRRPAAVCAGLGPGNGAAFRDGFFRSRRVFESGTDAGGRR